jgi:hypothetical protein
MIPSYVGFVYSDKYLHLSKIHTMKMNRLPSFLFYYCLRLIVFVRPGRWANNRAVLRLLVTEFTLSLIPRVLMRWITIWLMPSLEHIPTVQAKWITSVSIQSWQQLITMVFSIPSNAVIDGIMVEISKKVSQPRE